MKNTTKFIVSLVIIGLIAWGFTVKTTHAESVTPAQELVMWQDILVFVQARITALETQIDAQNVVAPVVGSAPAPTAQVQSVAPTCPSTPSIIVSPDNKNSDSLIGDNLYVSYVQGGYDYIDIALTDPCVSVGQLTFSYETHDIKDYATPHLWAGGKDYTKSLAFGTS